MIRVTYENGYEHMIFRRYSMLFDFHVNIFLSNILQSKIVTLFIIRYLYSLETGICHIIFVTNVEMQNKYESYFVYSTNRLGIKKGLNKLTLRPTVSIGLICIYGYMNISVELTLPC